MGKRPSRGQVTKASLGSSARASAKRRANQRGGRIHAPAVGDVTVAAAWDNTRTVKANLAGLGLASDPNAAVGPTAHRRLATQSSRPGAAAADNDGNDDAPPAVMSVTAAALAARASVGEAPRPHHPSDGEVATVRSLVAAHGAGNFGAMARDRKRNYLQHTPAALRAMCRRVGAAEAAAEAATDAVVAAAAEAAAAGVDVGGGGGGGGGGGKHRGKGRARA
ncbi:hypothetical protein BU14_0256s0020 [Porphyra umbilicalis]|uniref:Nucleolar protein 16 n=1 Tax=Porphyra umbilicalis TaxID=2786 RepID=A0A1X6P2K9_PORUM|nr:hypothetical protein BU14_0256s0020 [Porphyra umbilicalis]|eukprot:OSX75067.1 hypothetical protein BU14_0256s0020 [Porphyra umbilicalis]